MDASSSASLDDDLLLDDFTLRATLDADPRPAFIIDALDARVSSRQDQQDGISDVTQLRPLFCNKALLENVSLHHAVIHPHSPENVTDVGRAGQSRFHHWVIQGSAQRNHHGACEFAATSWIAYDVGTRHRVVSASAPSRQTSDTIQAKRDHDFTGTLVSKATASRTRFIEERLEGIVTIGKGLALPSSVGDIRLDFSYEEPSLKCTDWTAAESVGALTQHEIFARETDWASTPLGAMSTWDPVFRELANLVMRNPHPCTLVWGEELTMVYNEAYTREVAGKKHPALMGSGFFVDFPELWSDKKSVFQECAQTGQSIRMENDRLLIDRYGYLEETFFSWSWIPMYDASRKLLGFYNAPFETTYQMISARRMETLQQLGEAVSPARSVRQFWKAVIKGLETNPYDINFATVYVLQTPDGSDAGSFSSGSNVVTKDCILEATIGVPINHPAATARVDLQDDSALAPHMRLAAHTKEPVLLSAEDGSLPDFLTEGIHFRGFDMPSSEVLIVPLRSTYEINASAILTIGLNPRRRYDKDYRNFIGMLTRQLGTSLASTLLAEDEARKNRTAAELAALQRDHLTEQLELQKSRLRRMTEHSPLGMFLISPDGVLLEGNDRYYEMTNHPKDAYSLSFMETVAESNAHVALEYWSRMTVDRKPVSGDLLLSHNFNTEVDESGIPLEPWVLVSAVPEIGDDGEVRSVMGSITDISHYRYARRLQEQRLREAEETKQQQNVFIDIISHEMRNPLSAILICAEDIKNSLQSHRLDTANVSTTIIEECMEAADTISFCVQHQRTISDDVLTVSKLNSNLLVISPVPSDPVRLLQQAISMFSKECDTKQIDIKLQLHPSLTDLGIDKVMLDPGRLLQIMVNLLTNAIKFTQNSSTRSISVHLGSSLDPPTPTTKNLDYVPRRSAHAVISTGETWGSGSVIYLQAKVSDTGCGLTVEEKQRLFERFAQASPRTHAQYGGSGLGLFISRQLAELHGGQIGAASEAGVGSTFGFFIQCRKTAEPALDERVLPIRAPSLPTPAQTGLAVVQLPTSVHDVTIKAPLPPTPTIITTTLQPSNEKTMHVLVVEDNLVNQRVLKKQLEKAGCIVATADNGLHALAYLPTTTLYPHGTIPLSIILMDLEMPEMGGLECVTRIRALQAEGVMARRVPVVAVTANVRAEQMLLARDSGMDDIVSKPFKMPELLAKMASMVQADVASSVATL